MSCYCDGDDPGCEVCHPNMLPKARADLRARQLAQINLLGAAAKDSRGGDWHERDGAVVLAADYYREATRRANRWNAFGTALKEDPT